MTVITIISVMVGMMPGSEHVAHHLEEACAFEPRRLDVLLRHLSQRRKEDDAEKSPPVPEIDDGDAVERTRRQGERIGDADAQPVEQAEDAGHRRVDHALPDARGDRSGDDDGQEIDHLEEGAAAPRDEQHGGGEQPHADRHGEEDQRSR